MALEKHSLHPFIAPRSVAIVGVSPNWSYVNTILQQIVALKSPERVFPVNPKASELYGLTWVGIRTPEIYRLAFHSQSVPPLGANRGRLQDAALDHLIEGQDWPAATVRIDALLPYVPLWYEGQFAAMNQQITGYAPAPDGNWDGLATITKRTDIGSE